jgi:hypothetical protein
VTVNRLQALNDRQLEEEMQRLRRDAESFRVRAAAAAAAAKRAGYDPLSDPLRQRLASIQRFMEIELKDAEKEVRRRAAAAHGGSNALMKSAIAGT